MDYFLFILGLDGLIFFVDCVLGLWLKLLVTHWCFGYCWAPLAECQGFQDPPVSRLGCARSWEGTWLGQVTGPSWLQGCSVLCNLVLSNSSWGDWWMDWLEGACCLGLLGISLLVGAAEWWKTPLGGFSSSVSSSQVKLCFPCSSCFLPCLTIVGGEWAGAVRSVSAAWG